MFYCKLRSILVQVLAESARFWQETRLKIDAVVKSSISVFTFFVVGNRVEPRINCRPRGTFPPSLPSLLEVSPVFCGQFCFRLPILSDLVAVLLLLLFELAADNVRPPTVMVRMATTKPWHQSGLQIKVRRDTRWTVRLGNSVKRCVDLKF